jgi:Cellulase (glycosyl hydrolase family 5)
MRIIDVHTPWPSMPPVAFPAHPDGPGRSTRPPEAFRQGERRRGRARDRRGAPVELRQFRGRPATGTSLCAAISQWRAGVEAEVYELTEVGSGLSLWANTFVAIDRLDLLDAVRVMGGTLMAGEPASVYAQAVPWHSVTVHPQVRTLLMTRRAARGLGFGAWIVLIATLPGGAARGSAVAVSPQESRSRVEAGPLNNDGLAQSVQPSLPAPLKVVKTQLRNNRDERVRLRGVNTACLEWTSDGEGHILNTVRTAIRDWHVNVIRLPLAQDRWFGKAREQKDDSKAYRDLVRQVVDTCASQGCYIILDLHWSDAGAWGQQIGQHKMPDRNSVAFWKEAAGTYKNHPAVIFDLYNEPHDVSWDLWLKGGPVTERDRRTGKELKYEAVGMQEMLDTVRATGAKNVVIAGGLDWAYDLSGIRAGRQLVDRRGHGVVYANHAYPFKGDTVERWIAKMETATKTLPVIVSEFGADSRGASGARGEQWVRQVLQALHDHDWDWTAWDLHPFAGPRLISDWKYTPTPSFGKWVREALLGTLPQYAPPPTSSPPPVPARGAAAPVGIFEGHQDVGDVLHPGSVDLDVSGKSYTVSGSGANMWFTQDAFQFAWKRMSGDLALASDVVFLGAGTDPHRKACLMIRQSLDPDSAYVDVAVHGAGLTSLQFREAKGSATHEVQANVSAPKRLRIEKRGKYVRMDLAAKVGEPSYSGAAVRMVFEEPFYVGIGVCAHNKDVTEKAVFSSVELSAPLPAATGKPVLYSSLETQTLASTDRRVVLVAPTRIEAPNWG